jgi:uncharacterized protein (DUF736 family)
VGINKIGALWLKDGKSGKKFMSGTVEQEVPAGAKLLIFKNDHKSSDKHPDYTINLADDDAPQQQRQQRQAPPPPDDSDIPFALLWALFSLAMAGSQMIA